MSRWQGLYAITPIYPPPEPRLAEQVAQAIAGGARIVQYRDKACDADRRARAAGELLHVCRAQGVPLIINDDVELALRVGADGVHLGREDPDPAEARQRLGDRAIIGVSCYNQLARARWAQEVGAQYVAFGRFFPSITKPQAVSASPELLRQARRELHIPLVAIGGITPENGAALIAAGADMLAVVRSIFTRPDIRSAAQAFAGLFPTEIAVDDPIR
jgi:thiamine-phosphate pyrophosphorylase